MKLNNLFKPKIVKEARGRVIKDVHVKADLEKFRKAELTDPHIRTVIEHLIKITGKTEEEITAMIMLKVVKMEEATQHAPLLNRTMLQNAVETEAFNLLSDTYKGVPVAGAPVFNKTDFHNLYSAITNHWSSYRPMVNHFSTRAPLKGNGTCFVIPAFQKTEVDPENPTWADGTPRYRTKNKAGFKPTDVAQNKWMETVGTACATPKGEFVFNAHLMQNLINYAWLIGVKGNNPYFKSQGGEVPDEYAYVEFIIMHEFEHFRAGDFEYTKRLKLNPKIVNYTGDYRTNYILLKNGCVQLPIGLFSDDLNFDRYPSYMALYDAIKEEMSKLPKNKQKEIEDMLDDHLDDHEHEGEEGEEGDDSQKKSGGKSSDDQDDADQDQDGSGDGDGEGDEGDDPQDGSGGSGEDGDGDDSDEKSKSSKGKGSQSKNGKNGNDDQDGDPSGKGKTGKKQKPNPNGKPSPSTDATDGGEGGEGANADIDQQGKEIGGGGDNIKDGSHNDAANADRYGDKRESARQSDRDALDDANKKVAASAGQHRDSPFQRQQGEDNRSRANVGSSTTGNNFGGRSSFDEVDYKKVRPAFKWDTLLMQMLTAESEETETTYSRMSRDAARSMMTAASSPDGMAAVKPAEIAADDKRKVMFVVDCSGSMYYYIGKVFANVVNVLKSHASEVDSSEFYTIKFSHLYHTYRCNFTKKIYQEINSVRDPKAIGVPESEDVFFAKTINSNTEVSDAMTHDIESMIKKGYNVIFVTDGDCVGNNNLAYLLKKYTKHMYLLIACESDYVRYLEWLKGRPPNITYIEAGERRW